MKKLSVFFIVVLTLLILTSCGSRNNKTAENTKQPDKVSVRLKWVFTSHTAAGPGVALEKGYFKNENIEATLNPGGFEFDPVTLVASGSDDFGIKGADDVILARAKGIPIVVIAVDYQLNPVAYMSLKESNITDPQDFIGKKVGIKYGQNVYTFYKAMLRKLNIPEDKIEEVAVQFDVSPLLTGQIDVYPGYATFEPAIFKEKEIPINMILAKNYGVPAYGNVVFTTEKMIKENPDLVERFLKAYIHGWEFAVNNPEETAEIMNKLNPKFAKNAQLEMMKLTIPYISPETGFKIGSMTMKGWEETQQIMIDENIIDEKVDLSKAFTNEFINKIYK